VKKPPEFLGMLLKVDLELAEPVMPLVRLVTPVSRLDESNRVEDARLSATVGACDDDYVVESFETHAVHRAKVHYFEFRDPHFASVKQAVVAPL
jgi:hypothetical protein